jgi:ParB family chromosome partitioning protein
MSTQKKVLGRGLGALIPQRPQQQAAPEVPAGEPMPPGNALMQLRIEQIAPNPFQPRKSFNESSIDELARSVAEHGIVQPLVVTRSGDRYKLIAGERRFRAAQKAGLESVPVIVKEMTGEGEELQVALIENIQREDLNPIEEALAYHQLHEEFGLTQEEIAKRVGKERSTVANFLRLVKLPDAVKKLLAAGQLSMGHARALLAVDNAKKQEQLAERVVRKNLNVRQTEMLASENSPKTAEKPEKEKDVFTRDAEDKLQRTLRAKVEIDRKRRGGVVHIRFSSEEELIRLVDELMGRRR